MGVVGQADDIVADDVDPCRLDVRQSVRAALPFPPASRRRNAQFAIAGEKDRGGSRAGMRGNAVGAGPTLGQRRDQPRFFSGSGWTLGSGLDSGLGSGLTEAAKGNTENIERAWLCMFSCICTKRFLLCSM